MTNPARAALTNAVNRAIANGAPVFTNEPAKGVQTMPKHYHVGHNMAGYLPESDVYVYSDETAAIEASEFDAKRDYEDTLDSYAGTEYEPEAAHITLTGDNGDYWLDDSSRTTHYWVSDACDCDEGNEQLANED